MLEVMLLAVLCLADPHEAPSLPDAPPPRPPAHVTPPKFPVGPEAPAPKAPAAKTSAGKPEKGDKTDKGEKTDKSESAVAADKPAGAGHGRPARKAAAEKKDATPPSLTASALRGEVRGQGEEKGGGGERARLEQLAGDIARAREALRQDTARLEAMLKNGAPAGESRSAAADGESAAPVPASLGSREMLKEQIDTVSKAMKGMKPEQAAAIVSRLDRTLGAEILRRMRPADAGAVMGQLKPEVAADLATIIATKRPITNEPAKPEAKR